MRSSLRTLNGHTFSSDAATMEAESASTLFFHPLVKPTSSANPATYAAWTAKRDELLALAVRKHLFDFAAASTELGGCDAEDCRRRWAELDLAACVGFAEAAPVVEEGDAPAPSNFNIFHNSLAFMT